MSKKYYSLGNELASKDYVDTSIEETKDYVDASVEEAKVKTIILHAESTGFNQQYTISQSDIDKFLEEYNKGAFFEVLTKFDNIDDLRPTMMLSSKISGLDFFYIVIYTRADHLYVGDTSTLTIRPFNLEIQDNKASIIGQGSTHSRYPSAKAVYDLVKTKEKNIQTFTNSNQNPFIFDGKLPGIYINLSFENSYSSRTGDFYYKKSESSSVQSLWGMDCLFIIIDKDINDVQVGDTIGAVYAVYGYDPGATSFGGIDYRLILKDSDGFIKLDNYGRYQNIGMSFITKNRQYFQGEKTFASIPKVGSYTVPTQNTQLTAKKYVDDQDALKEDVANKVTSLDDQSTDDQYPSAKAVFDLIKVSSSVKELKHNGNANEFDFSVEEPGFYSPTYTYMSDIKWRTDSSQSYITMSGFAIFFMAYFEKIPETPVNNPDKVYATYYVAKNSDNFNLVMLNLIYNNNQYMLQEKMIGSRFAMLSNYGAQSIAGVKTFTSIPKQSNTTAPTQDTEFTNKKYVDDSIAAIPSGVNYFDARQEFLFEGKDVGIYYPTNTNRINFMYKFLSDDTGSGNNGTVVSFIITNKVAAENPDTSKVYAVGTFLDGAGSLKQFVVTYNGTKYIMTYYDNYYAASMLTVYSQTFRGEKTFVEIPKVSSYTAPTSNTQLTAKKYVNDQDNAILSNIASVYSSSATYSIGDYVLYNGVLYVCNTDISTAEEWTAAHWTQTTVMTELTSKIGNINSILATLTTPNTNGGGE